MKGKDFLNIGNMKVAFLLAECGPKA